MYDAFQRAREGGREGDEQLFRRAKKPTKAEELEVTLNARLERQQSMLSTHTRSGSTSSIISPLETPQPKRRSSGGYRRAHTVTPLSTIPSVYSEEGFRLENPRTFDIVSERSEIVRPVPQPSDPDPDLVNGNLASPSTTGRKALATNAILQEKLSWYMDTVEIHLISSISTASKSFFSALGSLRELHSEAADSVKRIKALRHDLATLDEKMALGGLKVVNLRQRRHNVRRLAEAVSQLQDVVNSVSNCGEMVDRGEIEDAMDGLDDLERVIGGEESSKLQNLSKTDLRNTQSGRIDLRGIKALQGASDELGRLRARIGRGYETRFLDGLLADLRNHVQSVPSEVTLQRWGTAFQRSRGAHRRAPSAFPAYMNLDTQVRSRLRSELNGLSRAHHTMPAAITFKAAVIREMKSLIRQYLPSSNDDDNESIMSASTPGGRQMSQQEKSSNLARNLRALDPEDAEAMFSKIYTGVSEALRRLSVQLKVLLDITSGISSPPNTGGMRSPRSPMRSPSVQSMDGSLNSRVQDHLIPTISFQEDLHQALDMSSLLGEAVDTVQVQISKIVKVRSDQTAQLSLPNFLRFFSLNRLFADECEAISGRSGTSLKSLVDSQIKDFVARFGEFQRQRLLQVMDSDKWDATDFGHEEHVLLSRLLEGSTQDPMLWLESTMIWLPDGERQSGIMTNGGVANGDEAVGVAKERIRPATVDGQKYIVPGSAMAILRSLDDFQHLTASIPSMSQEVAMRLLDCLKLFNSRSAQLILGAGATRSAGLKNITTKHLALASQALSFITAIIPYVREFFRRHCPGAGQVLVEFDKIKRLYQEHQSGIHEKLIEIMSSRAGFHVNVMKKIDWETQQQGVNAYIETLAKETGTLQKVLSKHLPEMSVSTIMTPVFASYRDQLSRAYQDIPLRSEGAKQR